MKEKDEDDVKPAVAAAGGEDSGSGDDGPTFQVIVLVSCIFVSSHPHPSPHPAYSRALSGHWIMTGSGN